MAKQQSPSVSYRAWRRKWRPTPVFLPGESYGQRSLMGYSPCCCKQLDITWWLSNKKPKQMEDEKETILFFIRLREGKWSVCCSVLLWPHGLQPTRLLCPWNFLGINTGGGCHFLLQTNSLTVQNLIQDQHSAFNIHISLDFFNLQEFLRLSSIFCFHF